MESQSSKYFEGTPLFRYLGQLCFKIKILFPCAFVTKGTNLPKGNLEHQWQLWGYLNPQT